MVVIVNLMIWVIIVIKLESLDSEINIDVLKVVFS